MMVKQSYTLGEIAKHLGAELRGSAEIVIMGVAPLERATAQQISFLGKGLTSGQKSHKHLLASTKAAAVILNAQDTADSPSPVLIVNDPYVAFAQVTALFNTAPRPQPGVHSTAIIGVQCHIPASVSIGAYSVIGDRVSIGENTVIGAHCRIQNDCQLGANSRLYDRVTLYYATRLGNAVVIHSGAVIGADGFGFANDKGKWVKIYQLGKVVIGDRVDIGANTCIDRGALQDTTIGDEVIIDNLVQIAHNVQIGKGCAIAGCTAIAGSVKIGNYCMIGGGVTINGHIEICDQVQIVGAATVYRSIDQAGAYSSAMPAQPFKESLKCIAAYHRLPELAKMLQKLDRMANEFTAVKQTGKLVGFIKRLFK
jgi:UDP-3-O-[3-hydroxymyristoyl] glucosamine N-acyltransferase